MLNYQRVVRWFTYQSWGFFHSYASLPEGKDEIRWWTIGWWIIWLLYSIVFGKRNGWWIGDWYPHQTPIISQAGATLLCTPWFLELYGHERSKTREKKNKNKNMKLDQRSHGGLMDYEWLWHIILICICVYIYIYIYTCVYIYYIYIFLASACKNFGGHLCYLFLVPIWGEEPHPKIAEEFRWCLVIRPCWMLVVANSSFCVNGEWVHVSST